MIQGGLVIRFVKVNEWTDSFVFYKDSINLLFNLNSMANPMVSFAIYPQHIVSDLSFYWWNVIFVVGNFSCDSNDTQ